MFWDVRLSPMFWSMQSSDVRGGLLFDAGHQEIWEIQI